MRSPPRDARRLDRRAVTLAAALVAAPAAGSGELRGGPVAPALAAAAVQGTAGRAAGQLDRRGANAAGRAPAGPSVASPADESPKEPSFEELVKLNAESLFGVPVEILEGGRFRASYRGAGAFARGFRTASSGTYPGIFSDPAGVRSISVRRVLLDGARGEFSFVGLGGGRAVSVFELEDDYAVRFRVRARNLEASARFVWHLNRRGRERIVVTIFPGLSVLGPGGRHVAATDPRFSGPPARWFDVNSPGVPVVIRYRKGRLEVQIAPRPPRPRAGRRAREPEAEPKPVEAVALDGLESVSSGALALEFDRVSLLVTDLTIEGKLPRNWLEAELARLRKAGRLLTRPPGSEEIQESAEAGRAAASGRGRPDLSKPDPEADEDL